MVVAGGAVKTTSGGVSSPRSGVVKVTVKVGAWTARPSREVKVTEGGVADSGVPISGSKRSSQPKKACWGEPAGKRPPDRSLVTVQASAPLVAESTVTVSSAVVVALPPVHGRGHSPSGERSRAQLHTTSDSRQSSSRR